MRSAYPIDLVEHLPVTFSIHQNHQFEMNVVLVYEDFEMGVQGKRVYDLIEEEVGGKGAARVTVWRFDFFYSSQLLQALSRQAEVADLIIVAPRDPDHLPPQVKKWLETWPAKRRVSSGALVAVFHPEAGAASSTSAAARLLSQAALRARMDFFCNTPVQDDVLSGLPQFAPPISPDATQQPADENSSRLGRQ